jgi:F0F1-type ATP synthase delta subunit
MAEVADGAAYNLLKQATDTLSPGNGAAGAGDGNIAAAEQSKRQYIGEADAEIISAVPLSARQRQMLEIRLIRMLKKQIIMKLTVDPSLIGGIRIVTNDFVIDDSIKRKLADMKSSITKEVFSSD